jgi:hypothetical protein
LFPRKDVSHILKKIKLVPTEEESLTRILVGVFKDLLQKHMTSILLYKSLDTLIQRTLAIDVIDFCLEGIRSLCFVRLKRKKNAKGYGFAAYEPHRFEALHYFHVQ